ARAETLTEGGEESAESVSISPGVDFAPPAPPLTAQGGAEVIRRLNAISGGIKTAMAGPNRARVQALFVAVNSQIKNKDFVPAAKLLDELEPLVRQIPTPSQGGAEAIRRLNAMSGDIKAALTGPNKARVQTLFVSVNGLIKSKDFVQAH